MKKLICSILFYLTAHVAAATAIVVIVTPQYILLGTDSKRQVLDANAVVQANQQVCKIQNVGGYYFALAGFTSSQASGYSASQIVAKQLQQAASYETAISNIKQELKNILAKELKQRQQQQPAAFAQLLSTDEPLLELVVLRLQNGVPQMEIIGFEKGAGSQVAVGSYTSRCPGDCPPGSQQIYFMGSYSGMEHFLAQQRPFTEPAMLVKQLIMEQAKVTPSSVGAPVNMVRFSADGTEWIK
ncbi:hypothetical protein [Paracnuella aquatica]|uniref:hypothetical protein n=1 Tax=Paracnuella aquatica TaxID=2268757 RepID=UPI000F510FBE|nr:hypothetical protein [Paracnuella aquatica]RPD46055.1 hypothetical protein DRJ53_14885 [Paracnuella aquatica]